MEYPHGKRLRELPGPLLLTGHTGFKGTWMTFFLEHLKVPVIGYSLAAEKDSLFDRADRAGAIPETIADIRDYVALEKFIDLHKPSSIIHMAAQPLVLKSYASPRETFDVNVMGTVNVLDIAFKKDFVKAIIIVTTDKVYRNDNSGRAFVETDPLEGKDPYSASKVGTESVVAAWQQIAKTSGGPKLFSVRAGNVIGGGDYADNRIFPDIARSILMNERVVIRNPNSTRPWQHVLDPISGYLKLLEHCQDGDPNASYNFGPEETSLSVLSVINQVKHKNSDIVNFEIRSEISAQESQTLNLKVSRAIAELNWIPRWNQEEAIDKTMIWWRGIKEGISARDLVLKDIENYLDR
jgi:CDP-glucose 4,6-dehydratase